MDLQQALVNGLLDTGFNDLPGQAGARTEIVNIHTCFEPQLVKKEFEYTLFARSINVFQPASPHFPYPVDNAWDAGVWHSAAPRPSAGSVIFPCAPAPIARKSPYLQ